MDDDAEVVADLRELLAITIECATRAADGLRYDFFNLRERVCVGLLHAVIEYAMAIHLIASNAMYYATSSVCRSALDALVDIKLACEVRGYCDSLGLADAQVWMRLMEKASAGKNTLLSGITDLGMLPLARRKYKEKIEGFKDTGVKVLGNEERFNRVGMNDHFDAAYKTLSAEADNNLSFITNHYFDIRQPRPTVRTRGSRPGSGNPKATLALMSEIVMDATEQVLGLCGHGVAVLAPARDAAARFNARRGTPPGG